MGGGSYDDDDDDDTSRCPHCKKKIKSQYEIEREKKRAKEDLINNYINCGSLTKNNKINDTMITYYNNKSLNIKNIIDRLYPTGELKKYNTNIFGYKCEKHKYFGLYTACLISIVPIFGLLSLRKNNNVIFRSFGLVKYIPFIYFPYKSGEKAIKEHVALEYHWLNRTFLNPELQRIPYFTSSTSGPYSKFTYHPILKLINLRDVDYRREDELYAQLNRIFCNNSYRMRMCIS